MARAASPGGNKPEEAEPRTEAAEPGDILESWKEIAAFIGRDLRTAKRWEKDRGMPVRRSPGGKGTRVYGSKRQIVEWLRRNQEPICDHDAGDDVTESSSRKPRVVLIVSFAGAVLVAGALVALTSHAVSRNPPARVRFGESSIEALDYLGRHLWTYPLRRRLEPSAVSERPGGLGRFVRLADLGGDGAREVVAVAAYRLGNNPDDPPEIEVLCLSESGKLLWRYVPRETFRFGDHDLSGPWNPEAILVSSARDHALWVAFSHSDWGDSYVVRIDGLTGETSLRYVNSGTIRCLAEVRTAQTTYVLAGGFNNEHDGPSLAVVDERKSFAASPQTAGTRHKCVSCPEGSPDYYFAFPRSEINRSQKVYEDPIGGINPNEGGFSISVMDLQFQTSTVRTVYQFAANPAIRPVSIRFSSTYLMMHRDLQRANQTDHTIEHCPERLHPPPVRMWTPAAGWTEVLLKAVD